MWCGGVLVGQKEKRLAAIKRSVNDVTFEELKKALEYYEFEVTNKSGGSHYSIWHPIEGIIEKMEPNTIPKHKPTVKPPYVRRALKWIERVIESEKYR